MDKIGKLIDGSEEKDAIHVAVAPVIAAYSLSPGQHIGFVKDDNETVGSMAGKKIGIVDPFLRSVINKGQRFWMFLYPNTITSLRHDWSHPDFHVVSDRKREAIYWITAWASKYAMTFEYAMKCGDNRDFFLGDEVGYDTIPSEFWDNYEILRDVKVSEETRENTHFHCAC